MTQHAVSHDERRSTYSSPTRAQPAKALSCEACEETLHPWSIGKTSVVLRCARCGHLIREHASSAATARQHPWGGLSALDHVRLALTWRRLHARLPAGRPLDVLEIGYGAGHTLRRLHTAGHRVSGVERHLLGALPSPVIPADVVRYEGAIEEVTLPPRAFDAVVGIHVIEHLTDPTRAFQRIAASLRPGGLLYCLTPNARSHGLTLFGEHWWNFEDPTHTRFFSPESARRMLTAVGFARVETRPLIMDSLTIETSSLLRTMTRGDTTHGILHTLPAAATSVALTPLALLARAVSPRLSPTMECVAYMPA